MVEGRLLRIARLLRCEPLDDYGLGTTYDPVDGPLADPQPVCDVLDAVALQERVQDQSLAGRQITKYAIPEVPFNDLLCWSWVAVREVSLALFDKALQGFLAAAIALLACLTAHRGQDC